MKSILIGLLVALPLAAAWAGNINDVGATTERALQMQRSGKFSVPNRPILKDAATRVYERYLESFTHPIPERFEDRQAGSFTTNR